MTEQGINEEDEDTVVDIPIRFDGTWSKREDILPTMELVLSSQLPLKSLPGREKRIEIVEAGRFA